MTGNRQGFTMVELIVVTVLGSLILLAALQVLITNQRTYTAQAEVITSQQTTRMGVEVLFAELRELSPAGGDILWMGPDSIRVRLMRKFAPVCDTDLGSPPSVTVIKELADLPIMGSANWFDVGDSVAVYADNDPDIETDDAWIYARITGIDSTLVLCPQLPIEPGIKLKFAGQSSLFTADSVGIGAPVRSYEEFAFGTTTLNGDTYLARRGSGDYVPVVGPIAATNGLQFVYRDSLGAVTTTPADVSQIEVVIRTGGRMLNSVGATVRDSVQVWIHTRN